MKFPETKIGFGITGSFCTFQKIFQEMKKLAETGADITPIFSYQAQRINSRFGKCDDFLTMAREISGKSPIVSIPQAEPVGPKKLFDIMIIAPCTGNTLAKLANGITDSPVLMAAKAHLRNNLPLVISLSTNDALGCNFKNVGSLFNMKNIYFVPFGQDHYKEKPNSMVADVSLLIPTIESALNNQQLQPVILSPKPLK